MQFESSPYIISFCITEEKHFDQTLHHHIFFRTNENISFEEVSYWIEEIYGKHGNYQSVRCEKNVLKYITKSDINPLFFGCDDSLFNFAYRARKWAEQTTVYKDSDPFVLNHPQYYKLLQRVHSEFHGDQKGELAPIEIDFIESLDKPEWKVKVYQWWNDWVTNGWTHKKKQLYLFGPPNTGKTTLIMELLKDNIPFEPPANAKSFAWADWDPERYNCVFIDEFKMDHYDETQWKKATAGESFVTNVKCEKPKRITTRCPMIFVSNDPPSDIAGIKERLEIIYAF